MVDDDLGYVAPWGLDPGQVRAPVLLLRGGHDRVAPTNKMLTSGNAGQVAV